MIRLSDFVVNPRRTPLKGEPDFTNLNDEKMREYRDLIQSLIFSYKYCDKEVTKTLQKVHKQISENLTERLAYDTMNVLSEQTESPKEEKELVKKTFQKPRRIKLVKSI